MANRFTRKAQNALNLSMQLASELGHTYIGSEHLLLALRLTQGCFFGRSKPLPYNMLLTYLGGASGTSPPTRRRRVRKYSPQAKFPYAASVSKALWGGANSRMGHNLTQGCFFGRSKPLLCKNVVNAFKRTVEVAKRREGNGMINVPSSHSPKWLPEPERDRTAVDRRPLQTMILFFLYPVKFSSVFTP